MLINSELLRYLKGADLSTSLTVNISRTKYIPVSRENAITELVRNKDVIHIGCSDHIKIIKEKIEKNIWLHKLITDNAKECIGIDINKESIEFLKNELGYSNVFHGDILVDTFNNITEKEWDYAVFGEMIEHLDNPVNFLKTFKSRFGNYIRKFIITVPNIYCINQYRNMMKFQENINSDHRFWFTPYTISKILVSAEFIPERIIYSNLLHLSKYDLIKRKIRVISGIQPKYPYYYFNTMIITGYLS